MRGLPVTLHRTPGQAHDGKTGLALIGTLGPGLRLLADAACDVNALRDVRAAKGAQTRIRPLARRNPMPAFDTTACRRRNRIERFFSKIKPFRAIATGYGMSGENFLNLICLASNRIWLRHHESAA